jgi:excisionase family DNA binding protein
MQDSEANSLQAPTQEWLDLHALTAYACISQRTIREWIHRPTNPLPAARVGGKLLVKRSVFDQWVMAHPVEPNETVDVIVNDMMRRMRG